MASLSVPTRPRFTIKLHRKNTPREMLLRDLQRVARQTEQSPSKAIYNRHGSFSAGALGRRFGSWNRALEAAGLPVNKNYRISEADLLDNLAKLWRKLGRQPRGSELVPKEGLSLYSTTAYVNRFGSWNNALQAFDGFINRGRVPKRPPRAQRQKPSRPRDAISWRLRATVLLRDKCACRMCGASPAKDPAVTLHIDHIVPWAKGGATTLRNLQTLCSACNIGKSDRPCPQPISRRRPPARGEKTSKRCSGARRSLRRKRRR